MSQPPLAPSPDEMHRQADALHQQGRTAEAERLCRLILTTRPGHAGALYLMGVIALEAGKPEPALELLSRAVAIDPDDAYHHLNFGVALFQTGRHAAALESYDQAIARDRSLFAALNNRASVLLVMGQAGAALDSVDRALAVRPRGVAAHLNRAQALLALGRSQEAFESFDRAVALAPDDPATIDQRGVALYRAGRLEAAAADYERILRTTPDHVEALSKHGAIMVDLKRHPEAALSFGRAYALTPDQPYLAGKLLHARLHTCDWRDYGALVEHIRAGVRAGLGVDAPLSFMNLPAAPADQLQCARIFVAEHVDAASAPLWRGERYDHGRIRLAYVSADLHQHVVTHVAARMFESHDRDRFEVIGVSLGPETDDPMRRRMKAAFETFIDARGLDDDALARLLREREIDIAVDLQGFTSNSRPGVFARRPAPVQVNYLGYPGTLGSGFHDYILADAQVIPPGHEDFYSEQAARLAGCYLPNDPKPIADAPPDRAREGLPEEGFVFCCFSNAYKISPAVFAAWMRILAKVDGSVLWLRDPGAPARDNLRREAAARGIDAGRLVFAAHLPMSEHLARHRLANLFLDTWPYNGHATASDALWAGLPILTCAVGGFASRVGSSLLHAAGVPELVTTSLSDYEALAVELAGASGFLAEAGARLAESRRTSVLFDAERFRQSLETAYQIMHERSRQGLPPQGFNIESVS